MIPQVHPSVGFAHSKHTLDVSHCDLVSTDRHGLSPYVLVEICHFVRVTLVQSWAAVSLGVNYVLAEEFLT